MEPEAPFVGLTFIDGTMTAGEVALAVVRKHFVAMIAKRDGTLEGSDPEDLHDMRVATRRIRAATSLFRGYLPADIMSRREDFAWLGGALGTVRDLDVQLEHVEKWATELAPGRAESLEPLEALLKRRRESARKRMVEALASDRYEALAGEFPEALVHPQPAAVDPSILSVAPALVEKRMRSFRRAGLALTSESPVEEFHVARIRAKKIRYAMEFVCPVYGKVAKDASLKLVAVQDLLGLHQDCVVAGAMIDDAVESERFPGAAMFSLGLLRQLVADRAAGLREAFPDLLKEAHGKDWHALTETMKRHLPQEPPDDQRDVADA